MQTSSNTDTRSRRGSARVDELLSDRNGILPVWIRSPKSGPEHYTGIGRSKLYELNAQGKIRSISIREPGQLKGTRLFDLRSILRFLDSCEGNEAPGGRVPSNVQGNWSGSDNPTAIIPKSTAGIGGDAE
jgi:hypothetical protein